MALYFKSGPCAVVKSEETNIGFTGPTFFFSSLPFPSELSSSLSPESPLSEPPSSDPPSEPDSLDPDSLLLEDDDSPEEDCDDELEELDEDVGVELAADDDAAEDAADEAADDAAFDAACDTVCVTVWVTTAFAGHGVEKIPLTQMVTSPEVNC
jgi:hypothetical protein